jgi:hypothetical protein
LVLLLGAAVRESLCVRVQDAAMMMMVMMMVVVVLCCLSAGALCEAAPVWTCVLQKEHPLL